MAWRIYYGDGSTFDALIGAWEDAPSRDVQAIVCENQEVGWYVVSNGDYYVPIGDGEFRAMDIFGLFDWLLEQGEVKFGRTISNEEFREIFKRASEDANFGRKAGYLNYERQP